MLNPFVPHPRTQLKDDSALASKTKIFRLMELKEADLCCICVCWAVSQYQYSVIANSAVCKPVLVSAWAGQGPAQSVNCELNSSYQEISEQSVSVEEWLVTQYPAD